jgi:hypothetical protein
MVRKCENTRTESHGAHQRTQSQLPRLIPKPFATSPIITYPTCMPTMPPYTLLSPKKSYWISTHLGPCFPHQNHFGGPSEHCLHCSEADASGQCRPSCGSQITMDGLEFTQGCMWKCGVPSAPHVSFQEGGICDGVTRVFGGISLVMIP